MIKLYSGTPGSGKSLHMAKDITYYCNCRRDRLVICNFEVNFHSFKHPERFVYIPNKDFKDSSVVLDLILEFYKTHDLMEDNIIIFIDECQILFNARSWNEKGRDTWLEFFTQHRKYGCNVFLVAQFDLMVDKQIRSLIEYEVIHRKVSNYGIYGFILKCLTFGDLFIAVEVWYALKLKVSSEFFKARKKYYSIYDTFNTFQSN